MSSITIQLEVPENIVNGLNNGSLERVGGVIRQSDNKRIVAWLREGRRMAGGTSTSGMLKSVIRAGGIPGAAALAMLDGPLPILDIAVAGYALVELISQIEDHQSRFEQIYDQVEEEFRRDRLIELNSALNYAKLIQSAQSADLKSQMVGQVTERLLQARAQLFWDIDEWHQGDQLAEKASQSLGYQILAMQVSTMIVRSWLDIGEETLALEWLSSAIRGHLERAQVFSRNRIGGSPALYFHSSISGEWLDRFLYIEGWLRGRHDVLRNVLEDNRQQFWHNDAISSLFSGGLNSQLLEDPFYMTSLPQAEILIENYQRLHGFELELKQLKLIESRFDEWDTFDGDDGVRLAEYDDFYLLVDQNALPISNGLDR
ncbi:MAG: hypothetical protein OXG85_07835 [Chloroflexi bacterium]|nr:hypothetical protein [Chloroflexota bacterium]